MSDTLEHVEPHGYVPDVSKAVDVVDDRVPTGEPADVEVVAGGRLRRLVPSRRQLDAGAELPDLDLTPARSTDETPKQGGRRWVSTALRDLDPRRIPGPKLPLIVFGIGGLVAGWDDVALAIAAPDIQAELGVGAATIVAIGSAASILSTVLGLPLGYLVDRVNRVWLVRIGQLIANLGSVLFSLAGNVSQITGARAAQAFGGRLEGPARLPLLADYYVPSARARAFTIVQVCQQVGGIAAGATAGAFVVIYGWRRASFGLAIAATVVSLLTFLLREPVRGAVDRLESGATLEEAAREPAKPTFGESIRSAWAVRTLRLQAMATFALALVAGPMQVLMALVLAGRFLLDPYQRGLIQTGTALAMLPVMLVSASIADRLLRRRPQTVVVIQAVLIICVAGATAIAAVAPNVWVFYTPITLISIGGAATLVASQVVTTLVAPARVRGMALALATPFTLLALILAPVLTSFAGQAGIQGALLVFVPIQVVAGLLYLASSSTVASDIRRARATNMAQQEVDLSVRERRAKILVVRDLDVAYGDVQVLHHVDLDVRDGEVLALVGTNGSGKSTLLKAISGLEHAANGAIFYDGRNVTDAPAHENAGRGIVYMPGGQAVFPDLPVRANLLLAGRRRHDDETEVAAAVEEVLARFPILRERLTTHAGSLSGGEQQMLAVGQALLMQPRLLLIDELSLGLAPAIVEQLLDTVREVQRAGTTVVLVEQSLNVALTIADRAVFLDKGEVQFDGRTEDLLARSDLVRAVFMGGTVSAGGVMSARHRTVADDEDGPLLVAEELTVTFGGHRALDEVSLSIAGGEIVGIIGPNGAGKSTLFDVLSGYVPPDTGHVVIGGQDMTAASPDARARAGLGRAFQNARLFPALTVRENITVALERRANRNPVAAALWLPSVRRSERRLRERVDGYVELLGLGAFADKFLSELSTGTRRAVEIACQMAAEPDVVLLDEPSSGLAQAETEVLGPTLLRMVRETGCALLVVEHDLPLVTRLSDRLIAMELGRVIATGPPDEVLRNPDVLRSYLAASADVIERSGSRVASVLQTITDQLAPTTASNSDPSDR